MPLSVSISFHYFHSLLSTINPNKNLITLSWHCFCIVKYTRKAHAVQRIESRWVEKRAQDIAWNSFVMNKVMTINYLYTEVTRRCQRYLFTFIIALTMKILEMNIWMKNIMNLYDVCVYYLSRRIWKSENENRENREKQEIWRSEQMKKSS